LLVTSWMPHWHLFDVRTGQLLFRSEPITAYRTNPVSFSQDGQSAGPVVIRGNVLSVRMDAGLEFRSLHRDDPLTKRGQEALALVASDRLLASGAFGWSRGVGLWDLDTGEHLDTLPNAGFVGNDPAGESLYTRHGQNLARYPVRLDAD